MKRMTSFQRFIDAQIPAYCDVIAELSRGRKQSHWMWFIFPQLIGLGQSEKAQYFGIRSLEEARQYAADPGVGRRLQQCTKIMTEIHGRTIVEILGRVDGLKFQSSMTLFAMAVPTEPLFEAALKKYFDGQRCAITVERLSKEM